MNKYILLVMFCLASFSLAAQFTFETEIDELAFLSDGFVNMRDVQHRQMTSELFYNKLKEFLQKPDSFAEDLSVLKAISVQYPEDQSFRLLSWQVEGDQGNYAYKTLFQNEKMLIDIEDMGKYDPDYDYIGLRPNTWLNQFVYAIDTRNIKGQPHYFIYGFRQLDKSQKVRSVDVLTIDESSIQFGKEVFQLAEPDQTGTKYRHSLTYSAYASGTLRFDENLDLIIFDNLILQPSGDPEVGLLAVPDGTYKGYSWTGNQWKYIDKIFNHVYDSAPRPKPVKRN